MRLTSPAQNWVDTDLYPFKSNFMTFNQGGMHYVDQGTGDVLLFIHGTPTWSFLYRDFITEFSKSYRCIAPDHLGFGLSDKPVKFDGKPQSHAQNIIAFIDKLGLTNITLVVHDFGGPIGLAAAIQNHEKIKQVVLFNSWLWETANNPEAQKVDKILNSSLGKFMYLRMNFSPKVLLKKGYYDKSNLPKKVHQQYIHPFPTKESRYGLLSIGKALVGSSAWYQKLWDNMPVLETKPWLIIWGDKDGFITPKYLKKWTQRLPNAQVHALNCGHFVQEEKTQESIEIMKNFLKE